MHTSARLLGDIYLEITLQPALSASLCAIFTLKGVVLYFIYIQFVCVVLTVL